MYREIIGLLEVGVLLLLEFMLPYDTNLYQMK